MVERMPSITDLPIAEITVPKDRLRPVSEAKVAALMQVIGEGVFLGAITVRRAGKINALIDGAHRLEAMSRLGRETIPADVLTCNASEARRMEITGNITAGMTPIQTWLSGCGPDGSTSAPNNGMRSATRRCWFRFWARRAAPS